jgi:hypothetical protein
MSDEPMRRRSIESQLHDDLVVDTCEQPGDEHRLARAVGGALATGGGLAALWLALRSITASKVVVIAIGTAAATSATAWVIARSQQDGITVGATSAAPAGDTIAGVDATQTRATQPQPPATLEVIHEPAVPSSPAASSTGATPRPNGPRAATAPSAEVTASEDTNRDDAATLLERAALARRDGRSDDAIAIYRAIGRRFPGSREDAVACVALGRALLASDADAALETFERCLRDHPRGQLAEPALVGRAEALAALGRHGDEAAAWVELLRRFPDSLHAERARSRSGR